MAETSKIPDTREEFYTDETREFVMQTLLEKGDTQALAIFVGLIEIADAIRTDLNDIA